MIEPRRSFRLLRNLCETPGVPGREERIRALVIERMKDLVDLVKVDQMGNVIGIKRPEGVSNPKKVMIAAHMDEIGFLVNHIDDDGFLKFVPVGGFDARTLMNQRVVVHGFKRDLPGIMTLARKPIHLQPKDEKPPQVTDYYIDLGMPKRRVERYVRVGDPITMDRRVIAIGECVTGKAFDDRLGLYVMLQALKALEGHEVEIYAVATVQEEVGLRGAQTSAFGIDPDVGIALDVTISNDLPGSPAHERVTKLGEGTAIKIMDSSSISDYNLVQFLRNLAEKNGIKYQMEILPRGGTDSGAMQRARAGIPVATISIPTRYVHTTVEMAHWGDIDASVRLLASFLEKAHEGKFGYSEV
ncbi:M42 family metallopeptidase [Candidatus Poribacteria bacterium]|nr:M42 family metallopeptidase [Candidatus Poribacteria bacterium]